MSKHVAHIHLFSIQKQYKKGFKQKKDTSVIEVSFIF